MKIKHISIISSLLPVALVILLFFGILISSEEENSSGNFSSGTASAGMNLSAEVLKHQSMVEKYAKEYGISEYGNVLLAIIQIESGGTEKDVMQSSESLGLPPNSLDAESSIKQGCKYFASLLSSAKNQGIEDINAVIQSYNFGEVIYLMYLKMERNTAIRLQKVFHVKNLEGKRLPIPIQLQLKEVMAGAGTMETSIMQN